MANTSYLFHYRAATASSRRTVSRAHLGEIGDLITFLAVTHCHRLDISSITWELHRGAIGEGATSKISQQELNLRWSLAFKRPVVAADQPNLLDDDYQVLISETLVLCDAATRNHPNIVTLEGICWDFDQENQNAWPVLIFEKAQEGDLGNFMTSKAGKAMNFTQRLQLCQDIARALTNIHSYSIIHGDINPRNILIFKEGEHYYAKLSDFGYSAVMTKEDSIDLAKTRPWNAPECDTTWRFNLIGARRTDIYSFGVLSLWIMFNEEANQNIKPKRETPPYNCDWIIALRHEKQLKTFAASQVASIASLTATRREKLQRFFDLALTEDPKKREMYSDGLFHEYEQYGGPIDEDAPDFIKANLTEIDDYIPNELPYTLMFQLTKIWWQVMIGDFRIWRNILNCLKARTNSRLETQVQAHASFQLALCYRIGFGCRKCQDQSSYWLTKSGKSIDDLEEEVKVIQSKQGLWHVGIVRELDTPPLHEVYGRCNILTEAERAYSESIMDLDGILDNDHRIIITLKVRLARIFIVQGRYIKAKTFLLDTLTSSTTATTSAMIIDVLLAAQGLMYQFSDMESSLLQLQAYWADVKAESTMAFYNQKPRAEGYLLFQLTRVYINLGRYGDAEEAALRQIEFTKKEHGEAHLSSLVAMCDLALVYICQEKMRHAKRILTNAISSGAQTLGDDHPEILRANQLLSSTVSSCKERKSNEAIALRNIEACKRTLGIKHQTTQDTIQSLATLLDGQGRIYEAFNWRTLSLAATKEAVGGAHWRTARAIQAVAISYFKLGNWDKSEELLASALEIFKNEVGGCHADTKYAAKLLTSIRKIVQVRAAVARVVPHSIIMRVIRLAGFFSSWMQRIRHYFA